MYPLDLEIANPFVSVRYNDAKIKLITRNLQFAGFLVYKFKSLY